MLQAEYGLDGVIVVDKPAGITSHGVVARVRRALHTRRIGHTGTLDPMATGVLPLVVGRATRLARFLTASEKTYDAEIRLGVATDTHDATGTAMPRSDSPLPTPGELEAVLDRFRGTFAQAPPAFSAKKIGGRRAYALARRQTPVAPAPVAVTVRQLELQAFVGDRVRLHIVSGAGFYVRALAHALGEAVGCGAHLTALRRVMSGEFALADAVALEQIEGEGREAARHLRPLSALLQNLPGLVLTDRGAERAAHGSPVAPEDAIDPNRAPGAASRLGGHDAASPLLVRLFDARGALVAIARPRDDWSTLQPVVVLV